MKFQQLLWFLANAFVSGIPKLGSLAHNPTNDQAHELKSTSCLVQILRRSNDDAHFCLSAAPFSFLKTLQAKVSKWVAVVYIYSYPFFFKGPDWTHKGKSGTARPTHCGFLASPYIIIFIMHSSDICVPGSDERGGDEKWSIAFLATPSPFF